MASKSYNGWAGDVRDLRSVWFFRISDKHLIPRAQSMACEMCGANYYTSYHAEEYGPSFFDYILGTHALCCRCHGMLHLRFSSPNRYNRYLNHIFNVEPAPEIKSLGQVFQMARGMKDIDHFPRPDIDHWSAKLESGKTPEKTPTRAFQCADTGKIIVTPDYYMECAPDIFWLYPELFPYSPRKTAPVFYQEAEHQCPGLHEEILEIHESIEDYKQAKGFKELYEQRTASHQ